MYILTKACLSLAEFGISCIKSLNAHYVVTMGGKSCTIQFVYCEGSIEHQIAHTNPINGKHSPTYLSSQRTKIKQKYKVEE
ncbi:hypothetical protein A9G45_12505 [Gilliamella sp. HK2]|uniref:hypothetical protein n=1 Tax=unclassified Gilliamella TaxID=2685620 RepID=UPI00080DC5F5|nr:hypothetical protein [Gilliamella apicola]OCG31264.1 hypothetical protein A9G46_11010 [Gilliamella apicola]OCG32173.1 hypothetical protein A9G45_12505 [Gilliamella apicola]